MSKKTKIVLPAPAGAEGLLMEYALAEAQLQQAKDAMKPLRERVIAMLPKGEPGDYFMQAGKWGLTASIPETVKWDADELIAYYGAGLPVFVKRTLSIPEADYKRLPLEEREGIAKARSFGTGSVKLDVEIVK